MENEASAGNVGLDLFCLGHGVAGLYEEESRVCNYKIWVGI